MNSKDEDQMQIDSRVCFDPDVEIVRWDDDPDSDTDSGPTIKIEPYDPSNIATFKGPASQALQNAIPCDLSTLAKAHEETAKRAVILKRNELKWKLMQASQVQNKAKLDEIKKELSYHREKLSKAQDLGARLRDKYVRVVKSAKLSEAQLKKAEINFQSQEKFVADEKMELTKIAIDCINVGKSLYGNEYRLPENPQAIECSVSANKSNEKTDLATNKIACSQEQQTPNIKKTKQKMSDLDLRSVILKKRKQVESSRLSCIYDPSESILGNIVTYRLTKKLTKTEQQEQPLTDLTYSHNQYPEEYVCLPDLISQCADKNCAYKHRSNYMKSDLDKLRDILASKPATTFNFLLSLQMTNQPQATEQEQ